MFCVVTVVCVHVYSASGHIYALCCDNGMCTCFYCESGMCTCLILTVVRIYVCVVRVVYVYVSYCDGGTCTCFIL